jgi:protocatechuate 3,4-dioxygenase beta subunit
VAAVAAPWAGVGFNFPLGLSVQVTDDTKFVAPAQQETALITQAIDHVDQLLKSGRVSTSAVLSDPQYLSLHEWPRFRLAIRSNAARGVLATVSPSENGTRLRFKGSVVDSRSRGTPARIYLYQTSSKGWYSEKAAHISGNSGDQRHARLFGYLLSDESGHFEVKTIRPAGYPESSLPAHIHVEIESLVNPGQVMITEALFADDPRLTPEARRRSEQEGFVICNVVHTPANGEEITAVFRANW